MSFVDLITIAAWVAVILFVGASWFGISLLYRRAGERGERKRAERAVVKEFKNGAHTVTFQWGPDAISQDPTGWLLVASGHHAVAASQPLDVFGYPGPGEGARILAESWDVHSRTDLVAQILSLLTSGHRASFDAERAHWHSLDQAGQRQLRKDLARAAMTSPTAREEYLRFERIRTDAQGARSIDFLAWDLDRVILLARAGVGAGYLSEPEGRDLALAAAAGLRSRYRGWDELNASFTRGRWYWRSMDGVEEASAAEHDRQFTRAAAPMWNLVPWEAALPAPTFVVLDGLPPQLVAFLAEQHLDQPWQAGLRSAVQARLT
ncbi:DUF1266 domain-containing protein [Ruania rhizosphaerae]|uniref:DUF1266 domain-containing protein n=1 Tax=Ruania rhizosphaerae TaxID=1840413 RepID=UPI00135762B1|nr:DUF1266 domain-containing protein [Ruania rhizosphaerae]